MNKHHIMSTVNDHKLQDTLFDSQSRSISQTNRYCMLTIKNTYTKCRLSQFLASITHTLCFHLYTLLIIKINYGSLFCSAIMGGTRGLHSTQIKKMANR